MLGTRPFPVTELQEIRTDALASIRHVFALLSASPVTHEAVARLAMVEYYGRHAAGLPRRSSAMIFPAPPAVPAPPADPMRQLADIVREVQLHGTADVDNARDLLRELEQLHIELGGEQLAPTDMDESETPSPPPSPTPPPVKFPVGTDQGPALTFPVGDGRHDLGLGAILYQEDYPRTPCLYPVDSTWHKEGSRKGFTIDAHLMVGGRPVHVSAHNIDWRIPIFGGRVVTGRALVALRHSCPRLRHKSLEARALILG